MSIQVLPTTSEGSKGRDRWLAGLVGGVALTAVMVAGIVTWQFASTTDRTETAADTSGQAIERSGVLPTDTLKARKARRRSSGRWTMRRRRT